MLSLTGRRISTLLIDSSDTKFWNYERACTFSSPTQTSPPDESNSMDLTPADTLALPPYKTSDKHITSGHLQLLLIFNNYSIFNL